MEDSPDPYAMFAEVLCHARATTRQRALTGEIVASYAEINHMLGRTKGRMLKRDWTSYADELLACVEAYTSARDSFVRGSAEILDEPSTGRLATERFLDVAERLRTVRDGLRAVLEDLGMSVWR